MMDWVAYRFGSFGLVCDIFQDGSAAVQIDPRTPDEGYLSQSSEDLVLVVSYGPAASLDSWIQKMEGERMAQVQLLEQRRPTLLCDLPAERIAYEVTPPPPALGSRAGEPIKSGPDSPFRITAVGTHYHGIPLLATFQRSLPDESTEAEQHFFQGFRCDSAG